MYQQNGIRSYRKTNVVTADPGKLVVMCYEGAIDNLLLAKQKDAAQEYEAKAQAFIKAQNIIDELLCSLDLEKGGLIAQNLQSLYTYMTKRLIHATANRDMDAVDEVVGMLRELLSAWNEVVAKPDSEIYPEATSYDENQMVQAANI
jgi:flagellar protein FliS